jgi:serine/threonine protein kinase
LLKKKLHLDRKHPESSTLMPKESHPWDEAWNFGERLGKGGQGLTHLVTSKKDSTVQAAVKILKNNKDSQARGRMHREVASLEVLSSAGGSVPRVLDHNTQFYGDDSVELFVVMEYVPGSTLREVVDARGRIPLDEAQKITTTLCETIKIAHTFPILHRDLKPENIIARDLATADIVVVDYGLSFNSVGTDVTVTDETFRNKFLDLPETNTPGGNLRDPRSDVTAACGILYYLVTGHVPGQLQGGDGRAPHLRTGYSIREVLGNAPRIGQIEMLLNRGFAPNIDDRFQTIDEFIHRLNSVLPDGHPTAAEDPIEVAQRLSIVLRQRDRTTQLLEFKKPAEELQAKILSFVQGHSGKLGRFMMNVTRIAGDHFALPTGIDSVLQTPAIQINPAHHNCLRVLAFCIGSRGEQCVLLKRTFTRSSTQPQIMPASGWQEVLWFDSSTAPDPALVIEDVKSWLNAAMQELTDEVTIR